jgi:hypothetical protein
MGRGIWLRGAAAVGLLVGITAGLPVGVHASGGSGCTSGQWTVMSTPAVPDQPTLSAVLALSSTDIWAGGGSNGLYPQSPPTELFEHWDGTSWMVVPGAGIPGGNIAALAGSSENDVWAFGSFPGFAGNEASLVEHWDGARWRHAVDGVPTGVVVSAVALGASDVWAYGRAVGGGYVEHWNGHTWTVMPTVGNGWGQIAASSDFNVWITDFQQTGHWNGVSWTFSPEAQPSDNSAVMNGIAVSPTAGPWAAGSQGLGAGVPEVQSWNGTGWSDTAVSGASSDGGSYTMMSAASSNDVWAVGTQDPQSAINETAAAHWDGAQWTSIPPANPSGYVDSLAAVSALPGQAWAVGTTWNSTLGDQPLIETYCA